MPNAEGGHFVVDNSKCVRWKKWRITKVTALFVTPIQCLISIYRRDTYAWCSLFVSWIPINEAVTCTLVEQLCHQIDESDEEMLIPNAEGECFMVDGEQIDGSSKSLVRPCRRPRQFGFEQLICSFILHWSLLRTLGSQYNNVWLRVTKIVLSRKAHRQVTICHSSQSSAALGSTRLIFGVAVTQSHCLHEQPGTAIKVANPTSQQ